MVAHVGRLSGMKAAAEQRARENGCEPSPYLFPRRDGTRGASDINKRRAAFCRAAGIENARLPDLRRSAASVLVSPGVLLPLVGAILAHSNPTTTARYSHLYADPVRNAIDRLGAIVTGGEEPRMLSLRQKRGIR
jgi:integrase